jgi:Zn-dependent protease
MVFILNVGLGVFNLIPLPPLDGGHFLPYFFPRASWGAIHKLEQYGPIILILAVMSGATRYVVGPAIAFVQSLLIALASLIV